MYQVVFTFVDWGGGEWAVCMYVVLFCFCCGLWLFCVFDYVLFFCCMSYLRKVFSKMGVLVFIFRQFALTL